MRINMTIITSVKGSSPAPLPLLEQVRRRGELGI